MVQGKCAVLKVVEAFVVYFSKYSLKWQGQIFKILSARILNCATLSAYISHAHLPHSDTSFVG